MWTGDWVTDALGLTVEPGPGPWALHDVVGLALRRNPRRAHLPVSLLLGKHVPADPRVARSTGLLLGEHVGHRLPGSASSAVVLGFAENATGLSRLVADGLDAEHIVSSTRRVVPGARSLGAFHEHHSHATRHLLVPDRPEHWTPDRPMVLVDDEVSTGATVAEGLRLLHRAAPRARYVLATLADLRGPDDDALERTAAELGVRVETVALASGRVRAPADVLDRAARLLVAHPRSAPSSAPSSAPVPAGYVDTVRLDLRGAPVDARHGIDRAGRTALEEALPDALDRLVDALGPRPGRILVLGTEELHHVPVRLAAALAETGFDVVVAATTRSPLVAIEAAGYPIASAAVFPAHDTALGAAGDRFVYGLDDRRGPRTETVVLVVDDAARGPALRRANGLLDLLRHRADHVVEAVVPTTRPARPPAAPVAAGSGIVLPRSGPRFGTFAPDEVSWLLSDLSSHDLEVGLERREREVAGGRHYSETLPEERAPEPARDELFRRALERSAGATAHLVGRVTDLVLATRGPRPVLVSLARAGTPVGVLMRRWARRVRGVELSHYSMSVLRGRGPDVVALRALCDAHDPGSLVFVDGWTGRAAIVDELATGLARLAGRGGRIDPAVAVLADPGHGSTLYGTREDVLVPTALLTATVCGLVSRTVRRPDLHGDAAYDGAKVYPELADADRTATFLDAVSARFTDRAGDHLPVAAAERTGPDRRGSAYVSALAEALAVADARLKPGIGETTRMLLRRSPARVLLAAGAGADVDHLRALCHDRAVPLGELPPRAGGIDCPYRSVGVVRGRSG